MMKLLVLCVVLLGAKVMAVSFSQAIADEFKQFKLQYNKKYKDQTEEEYRMKIYSENREKIAVHNQLYHQGLVNYTMAMNRFGDLLHCEFVAMMNGLKDVSKGVRRGTTFLRPSHVVLPDKVDWRKEGYVTPVKDQGECGSCWSFSATGSLEGQHFKKIGKLVSLSEQNLVDCSGKYGNNGCHGGEMDRAFQYIKDNGGIDTEESYPYEGVDGKCRYNRETVGESVTGYVDIETGSEQKLQEAVATVGPVSIGIDAGHLSFTFYSDGVYYEKRCRTDHLSHAVLAVGYDSEDGDDYWIVKNSFGVDWGIDGYIKMAKNKNNQCGVATGASYPLV